jgi:hypothetical protein
MNLGATLVAKRARSVPVRKGERSLLARQRLQTSSWRCHGAAVVGGDEEEEEEVVECCFFWGLMSMGGGGVCVCVFVCEVKYFFFLLLRLHPKPFEPGVFSPGSPTHRCGEEMESEGGGDGGGGGTGGG